MCGGGRGLRSLGSRAKAMITLFILPLVLAFSLSAVWALRVGGLQRLWILCALALLAVLSWRSCSPPCTPSLVRGECCVFPRVCGAFDSVGHRPTRVIEWLREDAPAPANCGVRWELDRACGGVCCGDLRVGRVVISTRYNSRVEGRWGWVAEMGGRGAWCAHPLEKSAPGFAGISIHCLDSQQLVRGALLR